MNRNNSRPALACVIALALFIPAPVEANPDVWVKSAVTYHFSDNRVTGLTYRWRFDNYFSSRNIETYDLDKSGQFESDEMERLRRETFDPLVKHGYHAHVWQDDSRYADLEATDFNAGIEDERLVFGFHLRLEPSADPFAGPVISSLFDAETVVDFRFVKKKFLLVEGTMPSGCKFRVARGKGAQDAHPQPVTLTCGE